MAYAYNFKVNCLKMLIIIEKSEHEIDSNYMLIPKPFSDALNLFSHCRRARRFASQMYKLYILAILWPIADAANKVRAYN